MLKTHPASPDNEAIRELRDSSKRLEKLTEELSKSSKSLERYTYVLIVLTILLFIITVDGMLFPPDFPFWIKATTLIIAFGMVLKMFPLNKKL
jgi:hypothetical protein